MKTIMFLLAAIAAAAAAAAAAEPIEGVPTQVLEHQEEDTQSSSSNRWLQATNSTIPEGPLAAIDTSFTCPCQSESNNSGGAEPMILQVLVYNVEGIKKMVEWNAEDYFDYTHGAIKIQVKTASSMTSLLEEIESDARLRGGLYDGYYTNPLALGTGAALNGFHDLTPYVKNPSSSHINDDVDWADVLLAIRTYMTNYEDKIYLIPLDGDTITLYYRKDIFEAYDLQVPRTWNEYIAVAKAVHGKVVNGTVVSGSCISRSVGDHAMYWYHMVLSTITQTNGATEGSLFDTKDMTPLLGEAAVEMIRIHQEQAQYGATDEFTARTERVHNDRMRDGSCAMTIMWGDLFRKSAASGSTLHDNMGIAATPGSEVVLNRENGKLERCTLELCPYAKYYEDIGLVNEAPYAANGIWGGAVSEHTTSAKQKALAEFFLWASSGTQSFKYALPNATSSIDKINGQDPWRRSQLDVDRWVEQGYDRELSSQYVKSIVSNLMSRNVVVDARFPKAAEIMGVLDAEVGGFLVKSKGNPNKDQEDDQSEKIKISESIARQWNQIIAKYDARDDTVAPILEIYQRLRGIYIENRKENHLTTVRPVGLTLMAIILSSSIGSAIWVYVNRESIVVKVSQPPFLWLICLGTTVLGSSIYTMGIDDSTSSKRGCDAACMITPWLVCLGFSITFAALTSKILRLKILMRHAAKFKRIQVKVRDVLLPFCVTLAINGALLLVWTLVDPSHWKRVAAGRTEAGQIESFGKCISQGSVSVVMLSLLTAVNMLGLLAANILAYQTRNLSVSFNEGKYVNFAMFSILEALVIGVPILALIDSNPVARYLMGSLVIFFMSMAVLLFMFVPKVWMMNHKDPLKISLGELSTGDQSGISAFHGVSGLSSAPQQNIISLSGMTPYEIATCGPNGVPEPDEHSVGALAF